MIKASKRSISSSFFENIDFNIIVFLILFLQFYFNTIKDNSESVNDQEIKKAKKYTFLDRIIQEAKEEGLEVVPINCTLKKCTKEEKIMICNEYQRSKVFERNLRLLEKAICEGQSVTFGGRDLYIVSSPEHESLKSKKLLYVKKFRMNQKIQNEQARQLEKHRELIKENFLNSQFFNKLPNINSFQSTNFPLRLPTILVQKKSIEFPLKLPTNLIKTKIKEEKI